jgi:nucleotide-binding universal stress UspA family protein
MEKAESEANEASKRLKTIFPLWNIQSEVYPESPTWALTKRASEWKANLLVVGAHGHTRLGRFIGSVSQLILLQAPCSVRVARAPQEKSKGEPLKILIGVDGSKEAEAALAVVKKREWPNGTQVRILSVIPAHFAVQMTHLVPPDIRTVHPNSALARRAVNQMVEDLLTQFNTGSIKAAPFVKEGDPKNILLSEAETWKADCILLGARGLSSVHRFLLGSVSMAVAARAHCSVEVIRS